MLLYYLVQMMMACAYQRNQPQTLSHQFSVSISYRYTPVELFRYCTFLIGLVVVELHVEGNEMVGGFLFIVFPLSTSFAQSTCTIICLQSTLCSAKMTIYPSPLSIQASSLQQITMSPENMTTTTGVPLRLLVSVKKFQIQHRNLAEHRNLFLSFQLVREMRVYAMKLCKVVTI